MSGSLSRQAVSREINNASPSKVIVLDDSLNEEAQDGQPSTPGGAGVPGAGGIETEREAEQNAEDTSEVGSRSKSLPLPRSSIEDADVCSRARLLRERRGRRPGHLASRSTKGLELS